MNRSALVLVSCLLAALAAACGGDDPQKVENRNTTLPSNPKGSVTGTVTNASRQPLAAASVTLDLAGKALVAETDAEGRFSFTGLPAGSTVGVEIAAEGKGTARFTVTLPVDAGDYPLGGASVTVGPIALYDRTGSLELGVLSDDGREVTPAGALCRTFATWADWSTGIEAIRGPVVEEAEVSAGKVRCVVPAHPELLRPSTGLTVIIPAQDTDGDGEPDLEGSERAFGFADFLEGVQGQDPILLWRIDTPLEVVATNIPSVGDADRILESVVDPAQGLDLVFNHPVEVHDLSVFDETGETKFKVKVETSGRKLQVRPDGEPWPAGQELNLHAWVAPERRPWEAHLLRAPFLTSGKETPSLIKATFEDLNDDGFLDAGEALRFELSGVIGTLDAGLLRLPFYFAVDLDGSSEIGDAACERGNQTPCWIFLDEPSFPGSDASGFSVHLYAEWMGASVDLSESPRVHLAFSQKDVEPAMDANGKPVLTDSDAKLTAVAP